MLIPINHKLREPLSAEGHRTTINYYVDEVAECEECETDEYLTRDDNGFLVCRKCGLVLSEKVLVHSYTKPKINFKTPNWRKPKVYDNKFHKIVDYCDNINNIIRVNFTRKGSKNYSERYQNPYAKSYENPNEKLIISHYGTKPNLEIDADSIDFNIGETQNMVSKGCPTISKTIYSNIKPCSKVLWHLWDSEPFDLGDNWFNDHTIEEFLPPIDMIKGIKLGVC